MLKHLVSFFLTSLSFVNAVKPNIILWIMDDIGWADVGYHGSNFPTPWIDKYAHNGVILDRMYAMPQCSPTRAAMITGMYSFRYGMQHFTTLMPGTLAGIPTDIKLLPEYLHPSYTTHMIGKWHLGYASWNQTPTMRGFESFVGFMQGQSDYFNHSLGSCKDVCMYPGNLGHVSPYGFTAGYDMWRNRTVSENDFKKYTDDIFVEELNTVLERSQKSQTPFFLYYSNQLIHLPLESPPNPLHLEKCKNVVGGSESINRTILCAMTSQMDASFGEMVKLLKKKKIWNNTIIIAISDNGGMTHWSDKYPASASSNYPLRGGKSTLFEGGVRVVSFVSGGYLPKFARSRIVKYPMHVVDLLPTIYALSQGSDQNYDSIDGIDGIDMWNTIIGLENKQHYEIPIQIDVNPLSIYGHVPHHRHHPSDGNINYTSFILWPYKLIVGSPYITGPEFEQSRDGWWTIDNYTWIHPPVETDPRLFNIEADPSETNNIADSNKIMVDVIIQRIKWWIKNKYQPAQFNYPWHRMNPKFYNWIWTPID